MLPSDDCYIWRIRRRPRITALSTTDDGGNSNYNGPLLSVQHRFNQHFTVLGNYTWSHCISDDDFGGDISGPCYQIPTNRDADRGNCGYDYRRLMNVSMIAESPFKGRDWTGRLLGNWQLSPSLHVQSGGPLNILSGKITRFPPKPWTGWIRFRVCHLTRHLGALNSRC